MSSSDTRARSRTLHAYRYSRLRSWLALAGAVAIIAVPSPGAGTEDDHALLSAIRFRSEFGLRADPEYVRAVARDHSGSQEWGVPLTPNELADMNRRVEIANSMDALNTFAATIPGIAGVYFDQQAGGEIVVAIAGDPTPYESEVAARIPGGATFRMRPVVHSRAQLDTLQDAIFGDRAALSAAGVDINAIIVDEAANAVEVGVTTASPFAVSLLEQRYGAGVIRVFQGGIATQTACIERANCAPPVRAGTAHLPEWCSLGFVVNHTGSIRVLTAGHWPCGHEGIDRYHGYWPNQYLLGQVWTRSWFGHEIYDTADAGAIGNLPPLLDDNLLYTYQGNSIAITSRSYGDNVNGPVCLSGRMTDGYRCGILLRTDATLGIDTNGIPGAELWLVEQREATYAVYFGDSGGAVYGGTTAYGIQSSCVDRDGDGECTEGNTPDNALYGHIQNVFNELTEHGGWMTLYLGD